MSLIRQKLVAESRVPPRTRTDLIIEFLTPFMVFCMVASVMMFLLDVRWVYTAVQAEYIRIVAFSIVMGIVALNRLVARDGSDESVLYIVALVGAVAMYTVGATSAFGVNAFAGDNLSTPANLAINISIVVTLWWATNRLTHECCVDGNPYAGDIGILTGTAQRMLGAIREGDSKPAPKKRKSLFKKEENKPRESFLYQLEIEPFDPTEHVPMDEAPPDIPVNEAPSKRPPRRHPGISIFYFSIPVMIAFSLGIRVTQHGGPAMITMGRFYMAIYCISALSLLMLSSLSSLREYFRQRYIQMPGGIGPFWVGVGFVMMIMVLAGALSLPMPDMPPLAHVGERQLDEWRRYDRFQPIPVVIDVAEQAQQARYIAYLKTFSWVCFGMLAAYWLMRAVGEYAFTMAKQRHQYPPWVVRTFERLDKILTSLTTIPAIVDFRPHKRRWVSRDIATCVTYRNPMASGDGSKTDRDVLEESYQALCALALDLGVPRRDDQTPYEFIKAFPRELSGLRKEAEALTGMYVGSAYANRRYTERDLDRVRKFWIQYERIRKAVVR